MFLSHEGFRAVLNSQWCTHRNKIVSNINTTWKNSNFDALLAFFMKYVFYFYLNFENKITFHKVYLSLASIHITNTRTPFLMVTLRRLKLTSTWDGTGNKPPDKSHPEICRPEIYHPDMKPPRRKLPRNQPPQQ